MNRSTSRIHFIITGGTIDSVCLDLNLQNQDSVLIKYLNNTIKPYFAFSYEVPFMKDSREITQKDRELLLEKIENSPVDKILLATEPIQWLKQLNFS